MLYILKINCFFEIATFLDLKKMIFCNIS
uniref:Uncharacterized protein n=1 Tax=Candidatus Enterococcus mansonii TaxID=1834181 RepID=A0A242C7N6_9ENTE|nr:hypothetical protein A5880_002977 [Enterococcus sp. 4G2_DIV0659]